jgi:hypothetical protein
VIIKRLRCSKSGSVGSVYGDEARPTDFASLYIEARRVEF